MDELMEKLKGQVIDHLNLEDVEKNEIGDDDELFGEGLGLDSIDALELIVLLEKEYDIKVQNPEEGKKIFYSIRTMADYIKENKGA